MSQEPVAEGRVLGMSVVQRVDPVSLNPLSVTHRTLAPAVVGLTSELEDPARDRDGDPVLGQLADERVHHFAEPPIFRLACDR